MTDVWVSGWATDYDGIGVVAIVFATQALAVEAGYGDAQRCSIIEALPNPIRWVRRRILWTDGVPGPESTTTHIDHFEVDARRAWIGSLRTDEHAPPNRRWISAEMWAPDTAENLGRWEAFVADITDHPEQEGGYTHWEEPIPTANTYDAVSDYSDHAV